MDIEFVYDYRSPYAYLANTQLGTLGAGIVYEPVNILAVMKAVNNQPSPLCPPKARYAGIDAARWAKHYGVAFSPNRALLQAMAASQFDGTLLSRAALAAQQLGVFANAHKALFEAVWASDADLVSVDGRKAFFTGRGVAAHEVWRLALDASIAELLANADRKAVERGVFGVPTFVVGGELFFGNDRLNFVKARALGRDSRL